MSTEQTATLASLRAGLRAAGPLAAAGLLANGCSLVVTVVLARVLDGRDYGALNQLIGIFFVVSTPGSAVLVAVVRRVAAWRSADGAVGEWAVQLHRRSRWALVGFSAAVLAGGLWLAALLGRNDPVAIDAIAIAGALWVALCVDRGLLQAHREYRSLSVNLVTEGALRTVCMIGLAGFGVTGIALGVLLAEIGTALQVRRMANRVWGLARRARGRVPVRLSRRDVVTAAITLGAVALLANADVIVMGREGPRAAGAYAAVSVSSKALVFVALVVAGYLLPEAALSWQDGGHALRQLWVTMGVLGVPALVLVGVAGGAPRLFLTTFFSARYVSAAPAFLPLALAMVCLSWVVVLVTYLLAVGDRRVWVYVVAGAVAVTGAVSAAHGVPRATAVADLRVEAVLLVVCGLELASVHYRRGYARQRWRVGA